jgi:hypothetical protein
MAQATLSHAEHRGMGMAHDGPSAFAVIPKRSIKTLECRLFQDGSRWPQFEAMESASPQT